MKQALLAMHGQMIEGSGLLDVLNQYEFSTIGLSAVVDVNSIKRASYCLQLTFCALYMKLKDVAPSDEDSKCPYEWLNNFSKESVMGLFWKMVMDFQMNYLIFFWSQREGNSSHYLNSLQKLVKWFFIFDKYNYSRWVSFIYLI